MGETIPQDQPNISTEEADQSIIKSIYGESGLKNSSPDWGGPNKPNIQGLNPEQSARFVYLSRNSSNTSVLERAELKELYDEIERWKEENIPKKRRPGYWN